MDSTTLKAKSKARSDAGRLGGQATVAKHGREHMSRIGKLGWQATLASVATRYPPPVGYNGGNSYRHLMRNLKAKKQG